MNIKNKFSKRSLGHLEQCHPDLQKVLRLAIDHSLVDFGLVESHRDEATQNDYNRRGLSKVRFPDSKHNTLPSEAVDIIIWPKSQMYDFNHLCYVAGVIQTCARVLYEDGMIDHLIRWGGNWDSDGIILKDQSFQDLVHFELVQPDAETEKELRGEKKPIETDPGDEQ